MSSFVTSLNSSSAQEIVNWVTSAYIRVCSQRRQFAVGKLVHTRRDCRQLVANFVYTADATQLDSWVESASAVSIRHDALAALAGRLGRKVSDPWWAVLYHQVNRAALPVALRWWRHHKHCTWYYRVIILLARGNRLVCTIDAGHQCLRTEKTARLEERVAKASSK